MKSLKLQTCYAVASTAVLVGLAACAGESTSTGPFSPTSARFAVGASTNSTPELGKVKVCKSASSNVSGDFDVTRTAVGASTGSAADATVAPNTCVIVAEDAGGSGIGSNITIDETSTADVQSVSAVRIDALIGGGSTTGAQAYTDGSTTLFVNSFHGFVVTYENINRAAGCTYTQGWYKNPKHQWPAGSYSSFDGGASYVDILNTPPKGNVYYILAHQYIAATLNVAGGASSSAITQALADAAAYFAAASPNNPLPGTWTKDQVTAIASALDAYNNGLTGPGHCSDEILTVE